MHGKRVSLLVLENIIRLVRATCENYTGADGTFRDQSQLTSGLSPFLFVVILDTVSEGFRKGIPWELLFADDLGVMTSCRRTG